MIRNAIAPAPNCARAKKNDTMPMDLMNNDNIFTGDETAEDINGLDGNDIIDGAGGVDTINGDNGDDTQIGGAGADILNGGDGTDTVDYSGASEGVEIITNGAGNGIGLKSEADGDVLTSIENFIGSDLMTSLPETRNFLS